MLSQNNPYLNDPEPIIEDYEPPPWGQGSINTLTEYSKEETAKERKERLALAKLRMPTIGFL